MLFHFGDTTVEIEPESIIFLKITAMIAAVWAVRISGSGQNTVLLTCWNNFIYLALMI